MRSKIRGKQIAVLLGASLAHPLASAQVTLPQEYDKTVKTAEALGTLGADLFGDQTSHYTGATTFSATDVSLPGNGGPPVAVGRRFVVESRGRKERAIIDPPDGTFGDWELDIPHLHGVFSTAGWQSSSADPNQRCEVLGETEAPPPTVTAGGPSYHAVWTAPEYWHGNSLYVPGAGDQEMLFVNGANPNKPSDGKSYHWVTNNQWYFSCLSTTKNGVAGDAFQAIAPDGTRYDFDWVVSRDTSSIGKQEGQVAPRDPEPNVLPGAPMSVIDRVEVWILPTWVQDRFGNWVKYTYDPTHPWRLNTIESKDGRKLTLTYNTQGQVETITDDIRTWNYAYQSEAISTSASRWWLDQVTLPDTTTWQFRLAGLRDAFTVPAADVLKACDDRASATTQPFYDGEITHPSGAIGKFQFQSKLHGRSNVQDLCQFVPGSTTEQMAAMYPYLFDTIALIKKEISNPVVDASYVWSYLYGPPNNSWKDDCVPGSCVSTKTVEVTGPNEFTRYTFGNRWKENEGKLLKVEQHSLAGTLLRKEETAYLLNPSGQLFPAQVGLSVYDRGDHTAETLSPTSSRTITQQGRTFSWQANSFDVYANPTNVTRSSKVTGSSTPDYSRTEEITYRHDTGIWVLGQVASVRDTETNLYSSQVDYYEASDTGPGAKLSMPKSTKAFGAVQYKTVTYHGDTGLLNAVTDNKDHTTSYTDYYRGVPKTVTFADSTSVTAEVDALGRITRVTDALNNATAYGYDNLGRLASVTPLATATPIGYDAVAGKTWTPTSIAYDRLTAQTPRHQLPVDTWRRTETTGVRVKETFYDSLWRPILERSKTTAPNALEAGRSSRAVYRRFDHEGRETFASYPSSELDEPEAGLPKAYDSLTEGTTTVYDALGRVTSTTVDSEELGDLITSTTYTPTAFTTVVTNPRGKTATTTYQAFDTPSFDAPMTIISEGVTTTFTRDDFGKPLTMTRTGSYAGESLSLARSYVYDTNQRLCKTIEPDAGVTVMGYDAAGNLSWRATGKNALKNVADCEYSSVLPDERSIYTYDARNRVLAIDHPGSTDDVGYTYFSDGAIQTATTGTVTVTAPTPPATVPVVGWSPKRTEWTYSYNKRRFLETESLLVDGRPFALGWDYDDLGQTSGLSYPSGLSVTFDPNVWGEPRRVAGPVNYARDVTYHANGAVRDFFYGNDAKRSVSLNDRMLPATISDSKVGKPTILDHTLTYDKNANLLGISGTTGGVTETRSMTYDGLDRLTWIDTPSVDEGYAYDALDNLRQTNVGGVTRDYQYDTTTRRLDRIVDGQDSTQLIYGWNARGEMSLRADYLGSEPIVQRFAFDDAGRLVQAPGLETYLYDAHGRRSLTVPCAGGAKRYQVYSRSGQLLYVEEGGVGTDYVSLGQSLVAKRVGTNTVYLHADHRGSPSVESDTAATITLRNRLMPYGSPYDGVLRSGPGLTGHQTDVATGLTYMQQRYYDPVAGRFLSPDSVAASNSSFNKYWFANNNPYKFGDPDGRASEFFERLMGREPEPSSNSYATKQAAKSVHDEVQRQIDTAPQQAMRAADVVLFALAFSPAGEVALAGLAAKSIRAVRSAEEGVAIFRGVHGAHPALAEARLGRSVPGNINGTVTPAEHNRGGAGVLSQSPYTSWTHNRTIAEEAAGANGVVLGVPAGAPPSGASWSWEASGASYDDRFRESEVLMRGVRDGCCVLR